MSPNFLARRGWTRTTLHAGDKITISYRPMKDGKNGGMFISGTTAAGKAPDHGRRRRRRTREIDATSTVRLLICCLASLALAAPAHAQAPGRILRPNAVVHVVADLERSVAFYRDAVGLPLTHRRGFPIGASSRATTLSIPGSDVRLTLVQSSGVPASPTWQRLQDPGSVKLVVRVRNIDAAFERVRARVARVYTDGGAPMKPEGPAAVNTSVIMRDPDGYPLELVLQDVPAISPAVPSTSNVVGGWATFIVGDAAASVEFYRTRLGFEAVSAPRPLSAAVLALQGTPRATGSVSAGVRPPGGVNTCGCTNSRTSTAPAWRADYRMPARPQFRSGWTTWRRSSSASRPPAFLSSVVPHRSTERPWPLSAT
jgi:catechol 2,3-dioxygenase-like lactoylglutathione lyase family enzyme